MPSIKWRIILLAIIGAGAAANHIEHWHRLNQLRLEAADTDSPVVQLGSTAGGHSTIEIDESSMSGRNFLHFATLGLWNYDRAKPTTCPEAVKAVDGRQVRMVGFMFPNDPTADPQMPRMFLLLRSTQTCCYGPRPQYNQYIYVQMTKPVKFERLSPVVVQGQFFVDPQPRENYIYRMDGRSCRVATGSDQPPTPEEFATQCDLPLFDITTLEQIKSIKDLAEREKEIARQLQPLDGKQMVVAGYVTTRSDSDPPSITVGKYAVLKALPAAAPGPLGPSPLGPLGGSLFGAPPGGRVAPPAAANPPASRLGSVLGPASMPDNFNTVQVWPAGEKQMPPNWWPQAAYRGTIHIIKPTQRGEKGIIVLDGATLATAASSAGAVTDDGLRFPLWLELLLLGAGAAAVGLGVVGLVRGPADGPICGGRR